MEKHIKSENQEEEPQDSNKLVVERISFDVMERRWNNFEPLFGKEQEKVMYTLLMYNLSPLASFWNQIEIGTVMSLYNIRVVRKLRNVVICNTIYSPYHCHETVSHTPVLCYTGWV